MKLRFICANHRQQLTENAKHANYSWQKGYDTGLALVDDGLISEAVPHLGCAFETAEIMLRKKMVDPMTAYERLTYTALLLGENLLKLKHAKQAMAIYSTTANRLEQERINKSRYQNVIDAHLKTLYGHIKPLQRRLERDRQKPTLSMWLEQTYRTLH